MGAVAGLETSDKLNTSRMISVIRSAARSRFRYPFGIVNMNRTWCLCLPGATHSVQLGITVA